MIDLAPIAVAPEAVPLDTADMVDSAASETVEDVVEPEQPVSPAETLQPDKPAETAPIEQAKPVDSAAALQPEQVQPDKVEPLQDAQPAEETVPDLVEAPLPEVALAVPQPRPELQEPKPVGQPKPAVREEKPKPAAKIGKNRAEKVKPVEKPAEKVAKVQKKPPPSISARKSGAQADRAAAPAPSSGAGKSMSPATWASKVNAHLARRKRGAGGRSGSATVRFTIDRGGSIVSASISRSSGDPQVDEAALSIVRRASPVPAPPPDLPRSALTLVVPVQFSRR